jgi:hypothetical protein
LFLHEFVFPSTYVENTMKANIVINEEGRTASTYIFSSSLLNYAY